MIAAVRTALWKRLRSDETLAGLLAPLPGNPAAPGVYTELSVPPVAQLPYVVISGPISDVPDDAFDAEYRDQLWDVHCYAARPDGGGGSAAEVDRIAERVRELLHRQPLVLADTSNPRNLVCEVRQLIVHNDDAAFGRVLSVRLFNAA